uniref:Uncharacterized protein n=1 Tax=Anguilla anguilla TaxID=7936 RepID=A0A0E9RIR6_ANGAN
MILLFEATLWSSSAW